MADFASLVGLEVIKPLPGHDVVFKEVHVSGNYLQFFSLFGKDVRDATEAVICRAHQGYPGFKRVVFHLFSKYNTFLPFALAYSISERVLSPM